MNQLLLPCHIPCCPHTWWPARLLHLSLHRNHQSSASCHPPPTKCSIPFCQANYSRNIGSHPSDLSIFTSAVASRDYSLPLLCYIFHIPPPIQLSTNSNFLPCLIATYYPGLHILKYTLRGAASFSCITPLSAICFPVTSQLLYINTVISSTPYRNQLQSLTSPTYPCKKALLQYLPQTPQTDPIASLSVPHPYFQFPP